MFGYTIVKKLYIKRLKEELELLYGLNHKLHKYHIKLRLRANKAEQAVDWDVDRNQPMWITMGNQIEAQEQTIAALTGENEELKLQIKELEEKKTDGQYEDEAIALANSHSN